MVYIDNLARLLRSVETGRVGRAASGQNDPKTAVLRVTAEGHRLADLASGSLRMEYDMDDT
jgi:hypothetical protein